MPAEGERVLVCALSGRAIAQSARAAGMAPVVLDGFADTDTAEAAAACERVALDAGWQLDAAALLDAAARLAPPPIPLIWGSGLERRPGLLARLAAGRELLGSPPETVTRVKDPSMLAAALRQLGLPHPETRLDPPAEPEGWLRKRAGGAGGTHIRPARGDDAAEPGWYFQRRVMGEPVSALVLGNGSDALVLGFSEQWPASGRAEAPYRFGGAAVPARLPSGLACELGAAVLRVARAFGLRGLASVDVLVSANGGWHLLEINPRPGAALDAYEAAFGVSLIGRHVAACRSGALAPLPSPRGAAASIIVYGRARRMTIPPGMAWPDWALDRTPEGRTVHAGEPLCTVTGSGADAGAAKLVAEARCGEILERVERRMPAGAPG
ncbi:MAG TPA: ATP-grasp domain-containing protein [Geminicoccaceae bacterium]|nr:ATP-grasp domain-containing protein [Geminicoccaceae bacterium]